MSIEDRKLRRMDENGRFTIPKAMREAMEIDGVEYPLWIHAVPSLKDCKRLVITK